MGLKPSTKGINQKKNSFGPQNQNYRVGKGPKTGFADDLIQGIVEKNVWTKFEESRSKTESWRPPATILKYYKNINI